MAARWVVVMRGSSIPPVVDVTSSAAEAAGVVSTVAGTGTAGYADGTGATAQFNAPYGVAVDGSGTVYVADQSNQRIRVVK